MKKSQPTQGVLITLGPKEIEQARKFAIERMVAKREDMSLHELINERPVDKINYNNGIIMQNIVETAGDLEPKPGITLNPPPTDGRCHCCGRHISELEPFGKAGDPLVGNFEGALLIKVFRTFARYDERAVLAMDEACESYESEGFADPLDWLINKYGKDEGERLNYGAQLCTSTFASWLCRDCIILSEDEYFERLEMRMHSY